jgi:Bardet-Biedl syndrome 9 protein
MSLFQAREFWSASSDAAGDEYDSACMVVCNIDNSPEGDDKIVTGSFGGMLRVWLPRAKRTNPSEAFEDLLVEVNLGAPILGLAAGRFST